jgi:Fe-Mn family superoxide dismutase
MAFELPPLPYPTNALEPHIDAKTMEIHHGKHHAAYVNNLNNAIKGHADLESKSAVDLVKNLAGVPEGIRAAVRNNAGGHVNHSLFWTLLTPGGSKAPTGKLAGDIEAKFGALDAFKAKFEEAGVKRFGSGWVWLVKKNGALDIISTPNQDNPLMAEYDATPVFGNDVWEHAYYLLYQNRRPDYLKAWWNVLNWDEVARQYAKA